MFSIYYYSLVRLLLDYIIITNVLLIYYILKQINKYERIVFEITN